MILPVNLSDEELLRLIEQAEQAKEQIQDVVLPPTQQPQQQAPKQATPPSRSPSENLFVWGFLELFYHSHIYADGNTVYFHGEIYKDSINDLKKLILQIAPDVMKAYNAIGIYNPDDMEIKLVIQSGGGCIDAGFNLIDFIESFHIPITTIGTGTVASMAVPVIQSGKKRFLTKNTNILIHQFRAGISGKRQDILDLLKHLEKVHKQLVNYISSRSKLSKSEVEEIMKFESWFTAEEALKMGIVDGLV